MDAVSSILYFGGHCDEDEELEFEPLRGINLVSYLLGQSSGHPAWSLFTLRSQTRPGNNVWSTLVIASGALLVT
jgi:hypothetical protein